MLGAANENRKPSGSGKPNTPSGSAEAPLGGAERTALALLRCGRSFAEAAESSGVSVGRAFELWTSHQSR